VSPAPRDGVPAARCRACAAAVAPGSVRCGQCGAAQRDETCPHCSAVAGASPHPELRFRCDVCGGPRIPIADPRIERSGREVPALRQARAAAMSRGGWRAAAIASGVLLGFEVVLFALLLLFLGASAGLFVAGLVTMAPIAAFSFWAMQRAKARGREITPALDAAWVGAATDVASQSRGGLTARGLATALGIAEPQAEELLALLEVNDVVRGAVTPGGDFAYAPRLRVDETPARADDASALAAEEEAITAGQAADPLPHRTAYVDPTKR
jgi:hypothetical protein